MCADSMYRRKQAGKQRSDLKVHGVDDFVIAKELYIPRDLLVRWGHGRSIRAVCRAFD